MKSYPRFMLAAGASGSGKTMITCGILQALKNRGMKVTSFKCGPDYIDPMFHEKVIHTRSGNLDTFFAGEELTRYLFCQNAEGCDISVMEGVMGYYDGLGGFSTKASACDLAEVTNTPVILVVNTRGMSLSTLAYIKGFLTFREPTRIQGVILNQISPMLYPQMKEQIENELGLQVCGYVPRMEDCSLESRHLGLVLPQEVEQLSEKLQHIASVLEDTLDLDQIVEIGRKAGDVGYFEQAEKKICCFIEKAAEEAAGKKQIRIAVSKDEAFCFIYEANMQLLRAMGVELIPFSPIHDKKLPSADGVLFYGGYPELFAKELSENEQMCRDVREKITGGMPCMAECGGFMYLHRSMEDMEDRSWPMAGVIDGKAYRTKKLGRFGYIELEPADGCTKDHRIKGHEFHYFDSTSCGESYLAKKPLSRRSWHCIHETETLMAGFPHLYYYSNPEFILEFLRKCRRYQEREKSYRTEDERR